MNDLPTSFEQHNVKSATRADMVPVAVQVKEGKYLTFELAQEQYGLGILKVREIMGMMDITHVPQTPAFVKGLINLRGRVIPVVDLRLKFGLPEKEYTERTTIIVVEIQAETGLILIGIVVDNVSEVMHISQADLEDTPSFGEKLKTDYIMGMAKVKGRVILLLDIDRVLTDEELTLAHG